MPAKVHRKLKENRNRNGTVYTISYFVHADTISAYRKVYGDNADSWTGGSGTYIYDYDEDRDGQHYICHYKAYSSGYEDNEGVTITSSTDVYRSYGVSIVTPEPEWWGIRQAEKLDYVMEAQAIDMTGDGDTFTGRANPGDWIYNNYWADKTDHEGSAVFALCPYAKANGNNIESVSDLPIYILNQKLNTVTYRVKYATNKRVNSFGEWEGVNPASNPFGLTKRNPYSTSKYLWKATTQSIQEDGYTDPDTGLVYNLVDRTCTRAIKTSGGQLYWHPDRNSGTWDWD